MQYHEFIGQVCHRAHLTNRDAGLRASQATLETLGERLYGGEPRHLGSQLPPELAQYLNEPGSGRGQRFSSEEFLRRVSEREGVGIDEATEHVCAVLEVLKQAVSPGEMDDVLDQLPPDYQRLFDCNILH